MNNEPEDEMIDGSQEVLLTLDEAVKFLDTSKSTLYRLLSQQDVKGVKVGKQWRFRKADLVAYIERSPVAVAFDAAAGADLDSELAYLEAEYFAATGTAVENDLESTAKSSELKIADLVAHILALAFVRSASDIHFEPNATALRLRYRIDGVLQEVQRIPLSLHESLIARLKELSGMNLIEKRFPQDGRILSRHGEKEYDLRLSLVPTLFGESVVMRILDRTCALLGLDVLGADSREFEPLLKTLHRGSGLVLVTGPTGAGKTTLLYSCLQEISAQDKKVITAEDPVEFQLADVTQIQINMRVGLTFAAAMHSALRQDPDVIMCGEIRDLETMELAVRATLTGHLVLSTLHTEDAVGAVLRMVGIGIDPYLVSASLKCVVAARLARRLCPRCKKTSGSSGGSTHEAKARELAANGGFRVPKDAVFYVAVGCDHCHRTGYRGRIGLFEVLPCTNKLIAEMIRCDSEDGAADLAIQSGMKTLFADGMRKAASGETSIDEVLRATGTWL